MSLSTFKSLRSKLLVKWILIKFSLLHCFDIKGIVNQSNKLNSNVDIIIVESDIEVYNPYIAIPQRKMHDCVHYTNSRFFFLTYIISFERLTLMCLVHMDNYKRFLVHKKWIFLWQTLFGLPESTFPAVATRHLWTILLACYSLMFLVRVPPYSSK